MNSIENEKLVREKLLIFQKSAKSIEDIASLNIHAHQGDNFKEVPIYASVSCGRPTIKIGGKTINLKTKQVLIKIYAHCGQIVHGSILRLTLQDGSYKSEEKETLEKKSSQSGNSKADINVSGKISTSAIGDASLGISASRNSSLTVDKSLSTKVESVPEINLIYSFGKDKIAIGDLHRGDPNQPDGFLFSEYPRKVLNSEAPPLFKASPDNDGLLKITVLAIIPEDKISHDIVDEENSPTFISKFSRKFRSNQQSTLSKISKIETKKISDETFSNYVEELRKKMAQNEISISAAIIQKSAREKFSVSDGHIIIEAQTFEITSQENNHG